MVNLISFDGLNCYYDAVMSAAGTLGADYVAAFHNLWAETRFRYDPFRRRFVSRFMMANLDAMGYHLEKLDCKGPQGVERRLSMLSGGELLVVGMDAYYVPWNPFFGLIFGPHYFVVEYTRDDPLAAYDSTYGYSGEPIPRSLLIDRACHLNVMRRCERTGLNIDSSAAIKSVAGSIPVHLEIMSKWLDRIQAGWQQGADPASLYVECMICNRKLFRRYLEQREPGVLSNMPVLDDNQFQQWIAVKNGLKKTSIGRVSFRLMNEIRQTLTGLMDQELRAAREYS
ncbi:MAG: hypothetical protein LBH66_06645 [Oscillospiraceae bacterium]|jgi:hypothetical protein|nr:hypothetical protein [Oscillospiraceae bacterium]